MNVGFNHLFIIPICRTYGTVKIDGKPYSTDMKSLAGLVKWLPVTTYSWDKNSLALSPEE